MPVATTGVYYVTRLLSNLAFCSFLELYDLSKINLNEQGVAHDSQSDLLPVASFVLLVTHSLLARIVNSQFYKQ